jgi:ketosteroid isomerase-like protein
MNLLSTLALALIVILAPCARAADVPSSHTRGTPVRSAELDAFQRAIRAQYDLKERAWAAQDHQALVTGFYSPSAFSAAEGEPTFFAQGRAQFLELYKTYVADTARIRIESVHTHVNGNMGWDWANFYADVKPEKVKDYPPSPVRILFLWEKIGGKWMCAGDVVLLGTFDTAARK